MLLLFTLIRQQTQRRNGRQSTWEKEGGLWEERMGIIFQYAMAACIAFIPIMPLFIRIILTFPLSGKSWFDDKINNLNIKHTKLLDNFIEYF